MAGEGSNGSVGGLVIRNHSQIYYRPLWSSPRCENTTEIESFKHLTAPLLRQEGRWSVTGNQSFCVDLESSVRHKQWIKWNLWQFTTKTTYISFGSLDLVVFLLSFGWLFVWPTLSIWFKDFIKKKQQNNKKTEILWPEIQSKQPHHFISIHLSSFILSALIDDAQ